MNTATTGDTKPYVCDTCGMAATLYVFPNHFAGIWDCNNCGASGECEHNDTELVSAGDGYTDACTNCGKEIL